MKTITTIEEERALPLGAVVIFPDGTAAQLDMYSGTLTNADLRGEYFWRLTNSTYVDSPLPDRLLPATLIHPVVFDEEDVDRAAKALRDDKANRAEYYHVPEWADTPYGDKLVYRSAARAVLGAVGSVEA